MKLDTPFYRLPLRFDAARLAAEVEQFAETEWKAHPQAYPGNTAIALVGVNGDPANDAVRGPMRPTPFLERCPYIRQVLASLQTVLGRTRLMRIAGRGEATLHVDTNYYWLNHVRVHIPAVTVPEVRFVCDDRDVHMAAGETWIFDTWRLHNVLNPNDRARIHLVADTVGTPAFWDLIVGAERPFDPRPGALPPKFVAFEPDRVSSLEFEGANFPIVMTPWEQECLIADVVELLPSGERSEELQLLLVRHNRGWRGLWARWGDTPPGHAAFASAVKQFERDLAPFAGKLSLANKVDAVEALMQAIVRPAVNADLMHHVEPRLQGSGLREEPLPRGRGSSEFERPVFIVAAPRSGSSLLFETLARSPEFWTVGGESHELFEDISQLTPAAHGFDSNRLTAADAEADTVTRLRAAFRANLRDREGNAPPADARGLRLLEKTPKNALRIQFLRAAFPGATFIYLHRDPRDNVSSAIDAWNSGRFVTYPNLPGWSGPKWSLLLPPGWRDLAGKSVGEIAAHQWRATHEQILADLADVPREQWTGVMYDELVSDPQGTAERLAKFAGVRWDQLLGRTLSLAKHTLTPPDPDKWKRNAAELEAVMPGLAETDRRVRAFFGRAGSVSDRRLLDNSPNSRSFAASAPVAHVPGSPPASEPLRSVHTGTLARLLASQRISLLVSTYQAGKLIVVRADGGTVNTHFRTYPSPMGLAVRGNRLAIGTKNAVWELRNRPEAARKLDPPGKHDALFLPHSAHVTSDIRIHEIDFAGDDLWLVNTRFSCLCTLAAGSSFVPQWRPPFISRLAPEDRCHLNGLAVVAGKPKYVSCLGATDTADGWRANKRNGGLLLDVPTGEVILSGLSMPHSPRLYRDRLWVLESGEGGIGYLDGGRLHTIARLPGFTRGLDFAGSLAFVGLSQVRESAVFAGLPLTERTEERACGVWVVDLTTGKTVAFLRFESGVQEVFAVQVLRDIAFPEVLNEDEAAIGNTFVLPDESLADVGAH